SVSGACVATSREKAATVPRLLDLSPLRRHEYGRLARARQSTVPGDCRAGAVARPGLDVVRTHLYETLRTSMRALTRALTRALRNAGSRPPVAVVHRRFTWPSGEQSSTQASGGVRAVVASDASAEPNAPASRLLVLAPVKILAKLHSRRA